MTIENPSEFSKEQLLQEASDWEHAEGNKGQVYTRPEVVSV